MKSRKPLLTFVSNSDAKLNEYRDLLAMPNLVRQPMPRAESTTEQLDMLVREKCQLVLAYVDPPFFVEHTALYVDVRPGWPGVASGHFFSKNSNADLLKLMKGYEGEERGASATIAIGYVQTRESKTKILEEQTRGRIVDDLRGKNGFGWDEIFVPENEVKTYAEMAPEEKNRISMRAKVAASFRILLEEHPEERERGRMIRVSGDTVLSQDNKRPIQPEPGILRSKNAANRGPSVFISYSHKDKRWLDLLLEQLASLKREGIEIWTDQDIEPGERWHDEIALALTRTRVAVLLVTPAFLASSYIADNELPTLLTAAKSDGLTVFWIQVKSSVKHDRIAQFQAAHSPSEPLDSLTAAKRNKALVSIAEKLQTAMSDDTKRRDAPPGE